LRREAPNRILCMALIHVGMMSLVALAVVSGTWVTVSPEEVAPTMAHSWTNRIGLVLAIAWPVQCGVGMVAIG
jgi:hypothetical protein